MTTTGGEVEEEVSDKVRDEDVVEAEVVDMVAGGGRVDVSVLVPVTMVLVTWKVEVE